MLKNSGSRIVVTLKALLDVAVEAAQLAGLPEGSIVLMGADENEAKGARHMKRLLKPDEQRKRPYPVTGSDLAFLAYSSGTTGLPKGVMLTHTNIVADVTQVRFSVGHNYSWKDDRILGLLPFFHIYGTAYSHPSHHLNGLSLTALRLDRPTKPTTSPRPRGGRHAAVQSGRLLHCCPALQDHVHVRRATRHRPVEQGCECAEIRSQLAAHDDERCGTVD